MSDSSTRFYEAEQQIDRALSLSMMGKNEEAMKAVDKAIELDPNFAEAYNKKGDFYFKAGKVKEALECYLKSKELNPNIQNNYYDLGRSYLVLGDYDNALENFRTALKMKPQTDIHAFIGKILFEQGKIDEAKASFDEVLKVNDGHTLTNYYYALILMQQGNMDQAKIYFNKVIEKYTRMVTAKPTLAEGYYYIGKAKFYMGEYFEAEKKFKLAIQYDTDEIDNHFSFEMFYSDAEAFAALAEAQAKIEKISEAKENIMKALALEPENKKLLDLKVKLGY